MEGQSKEKDGVWTTQNIRQECNNWTLEADAELLKHLQQFSQKLLLETHTALKSLDALESQLNTTYVKFSTVSNSFLSLSDTQFVENRVYEDEETANTAIASKPPEDNSNKNTDLVVAERLKEAINNGLKVINEKFETIKVPESDSEDDEDDSSVKSEMLLKPVNPYGDLVLPYLIGSAEFNSDDTVGLEDVASEDEIEEALSESDKISESEDSEPESDQTKVHQSMKDVDQDDIFSYNQANLAEQISLRLGDPSHQNTINPKGQKTFETVENKNTRNTTAEIKASLLKDIAYSDQSVSSSASSNEFITRSARDSEQDEPAPFFSDNDETDSLFQSESSFKPQKIPAGGISVLRPGVQLPSVQPTPQRKSSINDKEKIKPKQTVEKHNNPKNNTDYGSLSEDESPGLFGEKSKSKNEKSKYYDDDEDDDNLFAETSRIERTQSKKSPNSDIFSDSRSNKVSNFNTVSNNDLKKSFWLDSEKTFDESDNIFDSKGIFSDDEDDDLFSVSKQKISAIDKSTGKSKTHNFLGNQSNKNKGIEEASLFSENDIFFDDKSSSSANFFDVITGAGKNPSSDKVPKNVTDSKDKVFDDLFDDFNDEDDLFKDILPSKTVPVGEKRQTERALLKKTEPVQQINKPNIASKITEPIKSTDRINTQNVTAPKAEQTKTTDKIEQNVAPPEQTEQTKTMDKINNQNVALPKQTEQTKSMDKINNQNVSSPNETEQTKTTGKINNQNVVSPKQKEQTKTMDKINNHNAAPQKQIEKTKTMDEIINQNVALPKPTNKTNSTKTKAASNVVDFEEDDNDLFGESTSNSNFLTGSKFKDDVLKKEGKLFYDSGSDDDLFSTYKNTINSKTVPDNMAEEKKPLTKSFFNGEDLRSSDNDDKNLFESLGNISDSKTLFNKITNEKIEHQQPSKNHIIVEDRDMFKSSDGILTGTNQIDSSSLVEENEKKSEQISKPNGIKPGISFEKQNSSLEEIDSKSVKTNKIEPPKTLNIRQSNVKNGVIRSSLDSPDGAAISSSQSRPSPGKLSAELTKNIDPTTLFPGSRPKFIKHIDLPPTETIATLQNVVKERPKIQVKRRPPSRRARQQALRASQLEEESEDASKSRVIDTDTEPTSNLSPSKHKDDLFVNSDLGNDEITPRSFNLFGSPTDVSSSSIDDEPPPINGDSETNESSLLNYPTKGISLSDTLIVRAEESSSIKINNKETEEAVNKLVVPKESGNMFNEESDDDLFGEVSTIPKTSKVISTTVNTNDQWLNTEHNRSDDFLFPKNKTFPSSQLIKTSAKPSLIKTEKPQTTIPFERSDIFDDDLANMSGTSSLFPTSKEAKILQIPKTNFLFDDDDDGDIDDIFNHSMNVSSTQSKTQSSSDSGSISSKASGSSAQKSTLSSQQVFTDPLMSLQND